jgi:hypothetical protein
MVTFTISTKNNKKTNTHTRKNKEIKCHNFCKLNYLVKMKKMSKKKGFVNSISGKKYLYHACKKSFCNKPCENYHFFDDKIQKEQFKAQITNGFQNAYSKKQIQTLKRKGALSGCMFKKEYFNSL